MSPGEISASGEDHRPELDVGHIPMECGAPAGHALDSSGELHSREYYCLIL